MSGELTNVNRGRWCVNNNRMQNNRPFKIHFMAEENKTFCGHRLTKPVPADILGEWNPYDHLKNVCPNCLQWWEIVKPNHSAPEKTQT